MAITDLHIKIFCEDISSKRWDKAGKFLGKLLEDTPIEALNFVDFGGKQALYLWLDTLILTGLYKASPKGGYFFRKLVREVWVSEDYEQRWGLLCYTAWLFGEKLGRPASPEQCRAYLGELAGLMGIDRAEVFGLARTLDNKKNVCGAVQAPIQ